MKDLRGDLDNILMKAIALCRNFAKFRSLFSHPQRYLSWRFPLEGEDDTVDSNSKS